MANKFPAISQPLPDVKSIHTTVLEMKAAIEILSQQRGNLDISAVTWQDLVNADFFDKAGGHRLVRLLTDGGATLITSGNLSGTAVTITDIPATFAQLALKVTGASSGSTEQTQVQISNNNGASYDSVAGNYTGVKRTGTTFTLMSTASLTESATHLAAQTDSFTLLIEAYQGGLNPLSRAFITQNAVLYDCQAMYGGTLAINALKILGSAGGTFDAGTYALYGVR